MRQEWDIAAKAIQRQVTIVPVITVEESSLLVAMQGVVSGIKIQDDLKAWLDKPEQADLVKSIKATISPNMKPEKREQTLLTQAKNYIRNTGIKLN